MWELKHSSARKRKRKWTKNCAGLKTLEYLSTIQILPNSELIIPRTRCIFPSESVAHENNAEGALVPQYSQHVPPLRPGAIFPRARKQEQREWCAISTGTQAPHSLLSLPTARAQGHTNGWLLTADWATAAFTWSNQKLWNYSNILVTGHPSDQNPFPTQKALPICLQIAFFKCMWAFPGSHFQVPLAKRQFCICPSYRDLRCLSKFLLRSLREPETSCSSK